TKQTERYKIYYKRGMRLMSNIIFVSPGKYVQGKGALDRLGGNIKGFGKKPLILSGKTAWTVTEEQITQSLQSEKIDFQFVSFQGESSISEVNRIAEEGKKHGADLVIGVGGGKALDT